MNEHTDSLACLWGYITYNTRHLIVLYQDAEFALSSSFGLILIKLASMYFKSILSDSFCSSPGPALISLIVRDDVSTMLAFMASAECVSY